MALAFCTECLTIEGDWELDEDGHPVRCHSCDAEDSYQGLPEHDDYEDR